MNTTTPTTTEPRLEEIKRRCEAATADEWTYSDEFLFAGTPGIAEWTREASEADKQFLVHARTDIPALLEMVEGYERTIKEMTNRLHSCIPAKCPITQRPFFMCIEHPDLGLVPTYGGPYDSYTIPHIDAKDGKPWHECELYEYRYDHDMGAWVDGTNVVDLRLISEQGALIDFLELKSERDSLRERVEKLERAAIKSNLALQYLMPHEEMKLIDDEVTLEHATRCHTEAVAAIEKALSLSEGEG